MAESTTNPLWDAATGALPASDYAQAVARKLSITVQRVRAAIRLLDEGNTVPFIARYRKEMTGELDETELRDILAEYEFAKNLDQKKQDVLRLLDEQGVLTDAKLAESIHSRIRKATTLSEVDDIYRPYRPKRKTRAVVAKEQGLEPLAKWLLEAPRTETEGALRAYASTFVNQEKGVATDDDALSGALDILAEMISDDADNRQFVRAITKSQGSIKSRAAHPDASSVYEQYYDYSEPIMKVPPHRVLALFRGEREGVLKVSIAAPDESILNRLHQKYIRQPSPLSAWLEKAVDDSYKRLIAPAMERELKAELTDMAETHAIDVFGQNLKQLLLQPPLRGRRVLGVDPAYRTGCKLAVVDDTGKLLEVGVIYPTPPHNQIEAARDKVIQMIRSHRIEVIAIGNGTASRETEAFIAECISQHRFDSTLNKGHGNADVAYVMVSEAGASVYSASVIAKEEFPNLDVAERSAISIARRLQDPLAELVKIDPKSIGVGQYQHDVSQTKLGIELTDVVESAVNQVGVDVNTASHSLLTYVSGLNKTAAKNIVEFRQKNGRFKSRRDIAAVPRIGPKTLEQCVGFLRISDGENVLDATPIHPESYPVVEQLLRLSGGDLERLRDTRGRQSFLDSLAHVPVEELAQTLNVGVPTLRDIIEALKRPGRDPREDLPPPILRTDVVKLEDLREGMELMGTVRNVVDFGAFVDVGVKNDGLVHISELTTKFVKHPMDVVSVGDVVWVRVIGIDANKGRLQLSMKGLSRDTDRG